MGTTVRSGILTVLLAVLIGACSGQDSIPATAPTTTEASTTTITSTSTTVAPTTTVDRIAEIEAILADLELRRLQALYDEDRAAYEGVFANEAFLNRSLALFGSYVPELRPAAVAIQVERVIVESADCLVLRTFRDLSSLYPDDESAVGLSTVVIERVNDQWGFSYQYLEEEGWMCDGPHPLGS